MPLLRDDPAVIRVAVVRQPRRAAFAYSHLKLLDYIRKLIALVPCGDIPLRPGAHLAQRDTEQLSKNDLGKAPFRPDGRLLVSYPKSGRTWIDFATQSHGIDLMLTHAGCSTNWREIGRPFPGIPPALLDLPLIFLHRNPIDTAVSMYHHVIYRDLKRGSGRYLRLFLPLALRGALPPQDIDAFVLSPTHGIERICEFNRAWLSHLEGRRDCLVLTYEQMRASPEAGFQTMLDFLGIASVTGADLAHASDFQKMKQAELQGARPEAVPGRKVRKGKVGGYLEELRPETIAACRDVMARFDFV